MADQITTSSVVQVTMQDSSGNKQNFNIDNPKNDLTMAEIRTALTPIVNSGNWYSSYGNQFTAVQSATLTQSTKIKLSDSGVVVTITPSSATVPTTGKQYPSASTATFTVEGAPIQSAYLATPTVATEGKIMVLAPEINELQNSVTVKACQTNASISQNLSETVNLTIIVNNRQYNVPVTFTRTT